MRLAEEDLQGLAARAASLWERLAGGVRPEHTNGQDAVLDGRLRRWQLAVTGEEGGKGFSRRLAAEGMDEAACRIVLTPARYTSPPPWSKTLEDVLAHLSAGASLPDQEPHQDPILDPERPVPFEGVFLPFIHQARAQVGRLPVELTQQLAPAAWRSLERRLLEELSRLGAFPLGRQFQRSQLARSPLALFDGPGRALTQAPTRQYRRFVHGLRVGGLADFFREYALLARLLVQQVEQWCEAVAELCQRLQHDRQLLREAFRLPDAPGPITDARAGLSDRHHRGRTVITLTFGSGHRLVYKPRGLGMEVTFYDLLSWLNARDIPLPLRVPKVLDRGTYGWMEHVAREPCRTHQQIERYYERAGMLLCLVFLLEGVDCHCENLIAGGEHPVLVDLETLFHPRLATGEEVDTAGADMLASETLHHSVLWTGLLPAWEPGQQGKSFDISGLGATAEQATGFTVPAWENINTDAMTLGHREGVTRARQNEPEIDGTRPHAWDHAGAVADGFSRMYRWLLDHHDAVLAEAGPLTRFRHQQARVLFRPTSTYSVLLDRLRHPEYLRDAADWSIEVETLIRSLGPFRAGEQVPASWRVYLAEREALHDLDVPYFHGWTDQTLLWEGKQVVMESCSSEPSYDRVCRRLQNLNEDERTTQAGYIRAALESRRPALGTSRRAVGAEHEPDLEALEPSSKAELLDAARSIAEEIRSRSFRGADNSACWISFSFDTLNETLQLEPTGHDLYSGRAGIALFLAALEAVTGEAGFRELIWAAVKPLRSALQTGRAELDRRRRLALGAASGIGGLIYALTRIGRFLNDRELLEDAKQIVALVTPERIAQDDSFDVMGGVAGAILGLLALHGTTQDDGVREVALLCGHHLLDRRSPAATGYRVWNTGHSSRPLTGLSHGAAGIAYALLRLFQVTGEEGFRRAAEEAIAYETSTYSAEAHNWPDFRRGQSSSGDSPNFGTTWCHGAPGIGLARLGGLLALDSPQVRQDIENALRWEEAASVHGPDHLCCGNFGRLELLLEAGRRLGRPDCFAQAGRRVAWLLRRKGCTGSFVLHAAAAGTIYTPSLFIGTAGIGYQLLRMACPGELPSVLLWE